MYYNTSKELMQIYNNIIGNTPMSTEKLKA